MRIAPLAMAGALLFMATSGRAQDAAAPQQPPERPLALNPAAALTNGAWGFTLMTFDGFDRTKVDGVDTSTDGAADLVQQSGQQPGVSARFNVKTNPGKSMFSFTGDSTSAYYALADKALTDANASARQSTTIGRKTVLSAAEGFGYAPYQSLGLFPALGAAGGTEVAPPNAPGSEQGLALSQVYRYTVSGNLTHPLSARNTVSVDYGRSNTLAGDAAITTSRYQETGARLLHKLSQSFGYHTGYAYAQNGSLALHHFRLGIDGRKALSRSRRSVLVFGTDSTMIRRPATSLLPHTEFRLLGNVDFEQYIGRTWSTRASYNRDVAMIEGYAEPVFREALTAALAGAVNRRTTVGLNGSYVLAELPGVSADAAKQPDHALRSSLWLQMALARRLAVFSEYAYYQHNVGVLGSTLNVPSQLSRHRVHAGLVLVLTPRS